MSISTSSRYYSAPVETIVTNGVPRRTIIAQFYTYPGTYTLYQSVQGDTFDLLADRLFGDSGEFWRIADLNPQVPYPDEIPPGTLLRIPA